MEEAAATLQASRDLLVRVLVSYARQPVETASPLEYARLVSCPQTSPGLRSPGSMFDNLASLRERFRATREARKE